MNELQKILDKPYRTRTPLEDCIADAVTLEGEHDGDYTLMAKAAEQLARLMELARAVNKTGGVVVEYHRIGSESRPLRDWITELLNEIDGKEIK